jgi:putative FmdB family regulatory protein
MEVILMPRYDYKCKACGAHEIVSHGFDDEGPHECFDEKCTGTMQRVISPVPTFFNAKGFYKTGG